MWSQESERFMCAGDSIASIRDMACEYGARFTNSYHPRFDYNRGMACYALAYMIDSHQGIQLTTYAAGVAPYWGRRYFPIQ